MLVNIPFNVEHNSERINRTHDYSLRFLFKNKWFYEDISQNHRIYESAIGVRHLIFGSVTFCYFYKNKFKSFVRLWNCYRILNLNMFIVNSENVFYILIWWMESTLSWRPWSVDILTISFPGKVSGLDEDHRAESRSKTDRCLLIILVKIIIN